jgi:hypothetical protein
MSNREVMQQALEALASYSVGERPNASQVNDLIAQLEAALEQPEQEPTIWRDMVVVSLVREGIDKHKARELADHFAAQPEPPPEWVLIKNILDEYGLQAISFVAEWKAAQRPWQGLTDQEANLLWENTNDRDSWELIKRVEAKLKERNT